MRVNLKTLKKMKKSLELLNSIEVLRFYSCTIRRNEVNLQGHVSNEILEYCETIGISNFEFKNGNLNAKKDNLNLTLTY